MEARSLIGGEWTALTEAHFPVDTGLRITEVMYHPPAPETDDEAGHIDEDFEFLELSNRGDAALSLADLRLAGAVQILFGDQEIAPGESVVLVRDTEAFEARYGPSEATGITIAGVYDGRLANGGERILLGSSKRGRRGSGRGARRDRDGGGR